MNYFIQTLKLVGLLALLIIFVGYSMYHEMPKRSSIFAAPDPLSKEITFKISCAEKLGYIPGIGYEHGLCAQKITVKQIGEGAQHENFEEISEHTPLPFKEKLWPTASEQYGHYVYALSGGYTGASILTFKKPYKEVTGSPKDYKMPIGNTRWL